MPLLTVLTCVSVSEPLLMTAIEGGSVETPKSRETSRATQRLARAPPRKKKKKKKNIPPLHTHIHVARVLSLVVGSPHMECQACPSHLHESGKPSTGFLSFEIEPKTRF